jgi:hypothetical protein
MVLSEPPPWCLLVFSGPYYPSTAMPLKTPGRGPLFLQKIFPNIITFVGSYALPGAFFLSCVLGWCQKNRAGACLFGDKRIWKGGRAHFTSLFPTLKPALMGNFLNKCSYNSVPASMTPSTDSPPFCTHAALLPGQDHTWNLARVIVLICRLFNWVICFSQPVFTDPLRVFPLLRGHELLFGDYTFVILERLPQKNLCSHLAQVLFFMTKKINPSQERSDLLVSPPD